VDRRRALAVLGLDEGVDLPGLKQRFRALARDRHPDRGGDPAAFQDLHAAYELLRSTLSEGDGHPAPPRVARGRPSRGDDAAQATRSLDSARLRPVAQSLADTLVSDGASRALSRAPGSRLNRVAASLALGTVSRLEVRLVPSGEVDAPRRVRIELTVRSRPARRALTALDVGTLEGAAWTRHRGDGITVLTTEVVAPDVAAVARRAAAATARMLDALSWPLEAWHPE
jgi:hypothetical protein